MSQNIQLDILVINFNLSLNSFLYYCVRIGIASANLIFLQDVITNYSRSTYTHDSGDSTPRFDKQVK